MITLQQCKHVISLVLKQMSPGTSSQISSMSYNRDLIFFNKMRGELCANIITNPHLKDVLLLIHNAMVIQQINSVPVNQKCAISKKNMATSNSGISLLVYDRKRNMKHICIEKKYQSVCFAYYKIRNFPEIIKKKIKVYLNIQPWYIPQVHSLSFLNNKILASSIPNIVHLELMDAVECFNSF